MHLLSKRVARPFAGTAQSGTHGHESVVRLYDYEAGEITFKAAAT